MPDRIVVDVENRSGTKQGPGPIATVLDLEYGDALSRAASFQFTMPGRDSRASLLAVKTSVVRIFEGGSQVFVGVVEQLTRSVDERGSVLLTVSGRNMLAELAEQVMTATGDRRITLSGTGAASTIAFFGGFTLDTSPPSPLTGYSTTANGIYGVFGGMTALGALVRLSELTGEHFIVASNADRKIVWLRDTIADSGVRAVQGGADPVGLAANANVCVIQRLEIVQDAHELANVAYPFGGGMGGDAMIPMSASSYSTGTTGDFYVDITNNYVGHTVGLGYGTVPMEVYLSVNDATLSDYSDANLEAAGDMVVEAAMRWLEWHSTAQSFYSLEVLGLPASVRPGMSIRVIYQDAALTIDSSLTILEIVRRVGADGARTARLLVGSVDRWPADDAEAVVVKQAAGDAFMTSTQAVRTYYEMPFVENFDDTYPAYVDFDLGSAILRVESVVLKFQIHDFRSTIKTVTNGSLTIDSASPGATDSAADHFHSVTLANSTSGSAVTYSGSLNVSGGGSVTTQNAGSHAHGHSATHAHTGTSNVTIGSGIATQGPTATTSQVTYLIDGGTPTNSVAGPDGDGWYTLDLTPDVRDSGSLRPTGVAHRLSVIANSGKYGLLRARVQVSAFV